MRTDSSRSAIAFTLTPPPPRVRRVLPRGSRPRTGVGCVHAFYETAGNHVLWLETSAPGPPDRHSYRFSRDWEYLAAQLRDRTPVEFAD